jgi:hypothetical protein
MLSIPITRGSSLGFPRVKPTTPDGQALPPEVLRGSEQQELDLSAADDGLGGGVSWKVRALGPEK